MIFRVQNEKITIFRNLLQSQFGFKSGIAISQLTQFDFRPILQPYVQDQLKTGPRWPDCYNLLTQSLHGFNLNSVFKFISDSDSSDGSSTVSSLSESAGANQESAGWPAVQDRLIMNHRLEHRLRVYYPV